VGFGVRDAVAVAGHGMHMEPLSAKHGLDGGPGRGSRAQSTASTARACAVACRARRTRRARGAWHTD
jgi:hypothetical protein